ncbi:MAG: GyrI-like domain-containing protein [Treponema sp.]|jgi:AraC family transcriptional regulator|nr:GyrI-like domain-containing protein [Treponema sp.]
MQPKLIRLPALRLAGFICSTTTMLGENFTAIPKFWRQYQIDGRMERLQNEDFVKFHTHYGVCFFEDSASGNFQYLIGLEVKEGAAVPPEYEVRQLPSAAYAVFSTEPANEEDFFSAIYNTWAYIYGHWLPKSGLHIDGRSCDFELYDDRARPETGKVCDVYVPVVCAPGVTTFSGITDEPGTGEHSGAADYSETVFEKALELAYASPKTTAVNV